MITKTRRIGKIGNIGIAHEHSAEARWAWHRLGARQGQRKYGSGKGQARAVSTMALPGNFGITETP